MNKTSDFPKQENGTKQEINLELLQACKGLLNAYAWNANKTATEQGESALQSDVQRARLAIAKAERSLQDE